MFRNHLRLALAFSFFVNLVACSSAPINESDPNSLLQDAEGEIQSDHFQLAIDKLRIIKNKFPYSKVAVDAQLRIADVYFMQESYAEAAASYEAFQELHPKHEKAAYAMYRSAKSHFNDIPGNIARDLTGAHKAMETYSIFLRRYPNSTDAPAAQTELAAIRQLLGEKEISIGDFYYRRDFYDSAKPRYQKVIDLYPDTPAAKTAQEKLEKLEAQSKSNANP